MIYCGIPYLTNNQEKQLKQYIDEDRVFNYCKFALDNLRSDEISTYLTDVTDWFYTKKTANEITLFEVNVQDPTFLYVLHIHIRNKFPALIWTFEENQKVRF